MKVPLAVEAIVIVPVVFVIVILFPAVKVFAYHEVDEPIRSWPFEAFWSAIVLSVDKSPPPVKGPVVLIARVEETASIPNEKVTTPVEVLTNIGAVATVEET